MKFSVLFSYIELKTESHLLINIHVIFIFVYSYHDFHEIEITMAYISKGSLLPWTKTFMIYISKESSK